MLWPLPSNSSYNSWSQNNISNMAFIYVHDCLWGFGNRSPEAFVGKMTATSNWSSWDIIRKIWQDETLTIDMEIKWIDWTSPLRKCHWMAKEHNYGKIFLPPKFTLKEYATVTYLQSFYIYTTEWGVSITVIVELSIRSSPKLIWSVVLN